MGHRSRAGLLSLAAALFAASGGCNILMSAPVWSSDGKYVAYMVLKDRTEGARVRVFEFETAAVHQPDISIRQVAGAGDSFYCVAEKTGLVRLSPPRFVPVPVQGAPRDIAWIAPRPGGEGVYCAVRVTDNSTSLMYLETGTEGNALSEAYPGDAAYPAVSYDGRKLYFTRAGAAGHEVVCCDVARDGTVGGEKVVFKAEEKKDGEDGGVPAAVPDRSGGKLLVLMLNKPEIHIMNHDGGGAKRIPAPGEVIWGGFTADPDTLRLSVVDGGGVRAVEVSAGKAKVTEVGPDLERLYGTVTADPTGTVMAEVSPGGFRVADAAGAWQRFYPETDDERLHAAEAVVDATPMEALLYADDRKPADTDGLRWKLVRAHAYYLMNDDRLSARDAMEGLLLYPVSDLDIAAIARKLAKVPVGVDPAALAVVASLEAQPQESLKALGEAEPMIAMADMLAGIRFRSGEACFRLADFHGAAREFRKAAETEAFPQRDYAAVLSMVSYYLEGRTDLSAEIAAFLAEKMPKSSLNEEAQRLRKNLAVWAARPGRRRLRLCPGTDVVANERSDYRLQLVLTGENKVRVNRIPRVQLALENDVADGEKERRELVELQGMWAGYAPRQDTKAFAVATMYGRNVEVTAVKLPGSRLGGKLFKDAFAEEPAGNEELALEFSPSGKRVTIKARGINLEMELPEGRTDKTQE
ncbi:MAG: PD40 domain-containing protein [Planctomycetes bacterium]|nr:PD40 domain-containing protein [Planctomycetota bacterium]